MRVGDIDGAIELLRNGEVIGYPTEAVYGIGCDPWNKSSVVKVAEIKKRSFEKPFLMVAASVNQLEELVDVSSLSEDVMKSWPGHTTWLIKAKQSTPYWLRDNETGKVGVRVSDHPMIVKLCRFVVHVSAFNFGKLGLYTLHILTSAAPRLHDGQRDLLVPTSLQRMCLDIVL